jgi:hypothetical protein
MGLIFQLASLLGLAHIFADPTDMNSNHHNNIGHGGMDDEEFYDCSERDMEQGWDDDDDDDYDDVDIDSDHRDSETVNMSNRRPPGVASVSSYSSRSITSHCSEVISNTSDMKGNKKEKTYDDDDDKDGSNSSEEETKVQQLIKTVKTKAAESAVRYLLGQLLAGMTLLKSKITGSNNDDEETDHGEVLREEKDEILNDVKGSAQDQLGGNIDFNSASNAISGPAPSPT